MEAKDIVLLVLIISAIAIMGYAVYEIQTDGAKCLSNPLVYGVKQLEETNKVTASCACSTLEPNSAVLRVTSSEVFFDDIEKIPVVFNLTQSKNLFR